MIINQELCIGCGRCRAYCSMNCISFTRLPRHGNVVCTIDQNECVDCGICLRSNACKTTALYQPEHEYPRSLRSTFSNPLAEHKETRVPGRGTEEIKTNDITNRYMMGFAGIAAEMGRPGTGARMRDVQKVFMYLAKLNIEFEKCNPLTALLKNHKTGEMLPEVLDEKVLSCIIEMVVPIDMVIPVLDALEEAALEIDTLFSIDLTARVDDKLNVPVEEIMHRENRTFSFNGKTNIGLGRLTVKKI